MAGCLSCKDGGIMKYVFYAWLIAQCILAVHFIFLLVLVPAAEKRLKTMGYDIYLMDPRRQERARTDKPHNISGGTYQLGGTTELWIHITYKYAKHFQSTLGKRGIRTIYGMTGEESIPVLQAAADKLEDDIHDDYWEPTEGNAKKALLDCIELAKLAPHGVWDGD